MKIALSLLCLCLAATSLPAQNPAAPATPFALSADLDRLQSAASQASVDLGRMRIEKWKTDGESKRQAQANADSVQRNLTSALPELIQAVRISPQDLNAQFKLYRNLNVLYDVMAEVTESAGAFGQKSDFQAIGEQLETIDSVRHNLADSLDRLTLSNQSELNQLRAQIRSQQQAAAAAPPKKVVVDDTEPTKKTSKKKKPPPTKKPADTDSGTASGSNVAPGASAGVKP